MQAESMMADFMPHGHCYFWEPYILWSHAFSDGIIALAYMVIPFSLFYIFNKRKDFTYRWMVVLFAVFIFGCGVTHIFDVINIWYPIYRIDSAVRIITALASIGTAIVLIKFTHRITLIPTGRQWAQVNEELSASNEELSAANEELHAANEELQAANEELTLLNEQLSDAKEEIQRLSKEKLQHSQQKYQDLAESISDIFFALDASFHFTHWNKASEEFSGISADLAVGKSMYELYPHLRDSPLDQLYKKVMQTGRPDKFIYELGPKYENRVHEVNAYPTTEGISVITVDITSLQQAQNQIEEQKKQLELALWGADLGIWERDLVNDTLHCDDRYLQITGMKREDMETKLSDFTKRIHPEDRASVMEKLKTHEEGKAQSYREQYRIIDPSGQEKHKWVMSSAKIVKRNPEGRALRIVGVLQDITEMKQAEESNRFFKYLIDHTDDPIYWIDPHNDFRFVYVNEAACRHYGLPEEKLLNMSLPEWDPTFTMERCHLHWERIKREKYLNFESIHRNAKGEEIPVEISTNYLKYGDREFFGGHFRNISERKAHENKIIELQQRLEGIIDSAMDAIITTDAEQQIMIFNKSAEQMFGYTAQQIIGQPLSRLIPERFHSSHSSHILDFGASGKSNRKMGTNQSVFGINLMGKEFPIEASISQVKVGTQKYFTVIMRDITQRLQREQQEKALNKELIQQNEQLQQFGYITSHNLRSPVASLLGLIEVIDENEIKDPTYVQALHRIRVTAEKMDEIIQDLNQILEYQKSINAQREWVNFEDILESVKILIASSIQATNAKITASFEVSQLYTVKSYFQSIFHNLLSNAIKYKAPKRVPEIRIKTRKEKNDIIIEISDNGLGIDLKKNREKVFGLYKRFHHHVEGKGIGLHLVKTQTEALNGKVKVDSQLGKGTTFTLTLPIAEDKEG
ncbi:PAS domain S-box protein [Catalinimonas sp. 4WD22]|uniref:PAS domain S-box protein n=1 Tax=Catalinimonas locisalis TaxID=3133978 RepID=UPI0031018E8D